MSKLKIYKVVLFDLDGTLIDTSEGIFNSVRYAEKMMNLNPLPESELRKFIGPPPASSYMKYHGLTKEKAIQATAFHREYGSKFGAYEAKVYDGIPELLAKLKNEGIKLGVCTLKRQDIAEKVLEHFGMLKSFDTVVGIDSGESLSKADTINIALQKLNHQKKTDVVLIGDSLYDAEGAQKADIDFIGVLYGFGLNQNKKYYFNTVCLIENFL